MLTSRLPLWFACLLLVCQFAGCTDHLNPNPPPARLRVKTLTQFVPDAPGVPRSNSTTRISAFVYDDQNRLSLITTYQAPDSSVATVEHTVYQYDAKNRLSQLRRDVTLRPLNMFDPNQYEVYTFSYTGTGQVVAINYANNGPNGGGWQVNPAYNANNQVSGSSKLYSSGGLNYRENSTYIFTGNNLTFAASTSTTEVKQTILPGKLDATYTYDAGVNPFYGLYVIPAPGRVAGIATGGIFTYYTYYGGIADLFNLSQNNVLSSSFSYGGPLPYQASTYSYVYNSDNYPTARYTTTVNVSTRDVLYKETLLYEYETY